MSDRFQPLTLPTLASWVFGELEKRGSIFGIPRENFFQPNHGDAFRTELYGQPLETPFGVAAGPHSQMAQNIIAAWLHGARFIELKTIQTLDELDVSKPCIDMADEGYNVEWSQELKIDQSFNEYLMAWVIIHALHHRLGFDGQAPGMIFNMSVGYNLEGVLKPNVQGFLDRMENAGEALETAIADVAAAYPAIKDIAIPARLSDNVTLSTMHGCPPDEIGRIAAYLIEERGYHTNVKLNPTLLGPARLRQILNDILGFRNTIVPDEALAHDLKYPDALNILRDLEGRAARKGVDFGVKLSNTLETINHRDIFQKSEKMMYMSGRPLQAITVNLAATLSTEFNGKLRISYAGGADAWNVAELLACGFNTITSSSDLLRPGGYARLLQYLDETARAFDTMGAKNIPMWIRSSASALTDAEVDACALENLQRYAKKVLRDPLYHQDSYDRAATKTTRTLQFFDCIKAPCMDTCPIHQDVPAYMAAARNGEWDRAAAIIRQDNTMGVTLGRACNHACERPCVRTHLDEPLAIREMKRAILEYGRDVPAASHESAGRVAVIGAGPCGLGAAEILRASGVEVVVYEAMNRPGGMAAATLPAYRAIPDAIRRDVRRLKDAGVEFRFGQKAGTDFQLADLQQEYDYVILAVGAQNGMAPGIEGQELPGVLDGLDMLRAVRNGETLVLHGPVGVIGGGDVAMDCARVAKRLGGDVRILYRRTHAEMPAHREEVLGLLEEGIPIQELTLPKKAIAGKDGHLDALLCAKMRLGEPDESGRRRPEEVPGGTFEIKLKWLISAIGQKPDVNCLGDLPVERNAKGFLQTDSATGRTNLAWLYAGGDIVNQGPETLVRALADGRNIARDILLQLRQNNPKIPMPRKPRKHDPASTHIRDALPEFIRNRATRIRRAAIPETPPQVRSGFDEVVQTLDKEAAQNEAARCLSCDTFCSICTSVCPNHAFITYFSATHIADLPVWKWLNGKLQAAENTEHFSVHQSSQTAVFTDFCNECGNCASFCPTAGRPYADKPRIYYSRSEFEAQTDNAFRITRGAYGRHIYSRFGGETYSIQPLPESAGYLYTAPWGTIRTDFILNPQEDPIPAADIAEGCRISLLPAAIMRTILRGIASAQMPLPLDETEPPADADASTAHEDSDHE